MQRGGETSTSVSSGTADTCWPTYCRSVRPYSSVIVSGLLRLSAPGDNSIHLDLSPAPFHFARPADICRSPPQLSCFQFSQIPVNAPVKPVFCPTRAALRLATARNRRKILALDRYANRLAYSIYLHEAPLSLRPLEALFQLICHQVLRRCSTSQTQRVQIQVNDTVGHYKSLRYVQ